MEFDIGNLWRVLNCALIFYWLIRSIRVYRSLEILSKEHRGVAMGTPLLLLVTLYSTAEAVAHQVPFAPRVLIYTPVLLFMVISLELLLRKLESKKNHESTTRP